MGFGQLYGALLTAIADEADAMSMRAFRADDLQVERKRDGTALTQADGAIEAMARAKVAASGMPLDVYGEEMGTGSPQSSVTTAGRSTSGGGGATSSSARARATFYRSLIVAHRRGSDNAHA